MRSERGISFIKDAAPDLLSILSSAGSTIPPPAGPIIKGLAETCLKVINIAKSYSSSKQDIFHLSIRSAQVVTVIVNKCVLPKGSNIDIHRNLSQVHEILQEIYLWTKKQSVKGNWIDRLDKLLRAEDTIQEVNHLNKRLDYALQLFELQSLIDSRKMLPEVQSMIAEYISDNKVTDMIQSIKSELGPSIRTLHSSDPRCHPETRRVLLDSIENWLLDSRSNPKVRTPSIYWLTGAAGSGKSTISRSVIEIAKKHRLLFSCFYFSRDYNSRRTSDNLMTTVALDLISSRNTTLVKMIYEAVQEEKAHTSHFSKQVDQLLKRPLEAIDFPVILVWDALDECTETAPRRELLTMLKETIPRLPRSTRIFLTSRPEHDLELTREALEATDPDLIQHHDLTFQGDKDDSTLEDIDVYIRHRFQQMSAAKMGWPGEEALAKLNTIIDGLFIIAQFVCNFVQDDCDELESFLEGPTYDEGDMKDDEANGTLYFWYRTGLEQLFRRGLARRRQSVMLVIGAILVVQYPVSQRVLTILLALDDQTTKKILDELSPFLIQEARKTEDAAPSLHSVRFIHKSISDFLGSARAGSFQIDAVSASAALAVPCLKILCDQVSEALRSIYSPTPSATGGAKQQENQGPRISEELAYACRYWAFHLKDRLNLDEGGKALLEDLFHSHLMEWMHLMGGLNALETAISCLHWVEDCVPAIATRELLQLASDGIRFIEAFHDPLRTCADPESVLLHFTPTEARLYQVYYSKVTRRCLVVKGLPNRWPRLLNALNGHTESVHSVEFSPDAKRVVSGSADGTVRVWNALTGQPLGSPLIGHTSWVKSVAFSPNGKRIVSGSDDRTLRIWNASTGQLLGVLEGHQSFVFSVAFSPDGQRIASGSGDSTVRIWDALTGQLLRKPLEGHLSWIRSVGFSLDGRRIVSGSDDMTLRIWNASTGRLLKICPEGHLHFVLSVAFSPDGQRIVSGSGDRTLRIWDTLSGRLLGTPLEGHSGFVLSVQFSPDGKRIASGSADGTVRIWDALTGEPLGTPLEGHTDYVSSVAFSPDGTYLVSGSDDTTLRIWNASTGQPLGTPLEGHTDFVNSVAFSPDGKHIVSGSDDTTLRIWDTSTELPVGAALEGHTDFVLSVAFSPDGKCIASGSADKTVRLWDASTRQPLGSPLEGHIDYVFSVAFSPDGQRVVSGSEDETIRIWDVSTGNPLGTPLEGHTRMINSVTFSPDGKYIVSGSDDETLRIWNASTGQLLGTSPAGHTHFVSSVAFSPDGQRIISGSGDSTMRMWSASPGLPLGTTTEGLTGESGNTTTLKWGAMSRSLLENPIEGHTDMISSAAFSHDGRYIVSASRDKTVRIWNASTQQQVGASLEGHTDFVLSVAFSPDGQRIVSGSADTTVRIWDASTSQLETSEGHTSRVDSIAYSPDGKRIVSGSGDRTVRIWDTLTGQLLGAPFREHKGPVVNVAFSLDGKRIISESYEGLLVWDASSGELLDSNEIMDITEPSHTTTVSLHEDGWLKTNDNHQILWLPVDYRGKAIAWSEPLRCLAIGSNTGLVTIIQLL